jgi:dienelactone hydrolase
MGEMMMNTPTTLMAASAALLLAINFNSPAAGPAPAAPPTRTASQTPPRADISKFKLEGDPTSSQGATWTYESTDDGVDYQLNGILFKPAGNGPFPAVLISHGQGQTVNEFGARVSKEMVKWGLVCIAPNYTFAGGDKGEGAPGAADKRYCNPTDNLKRVRKCLDILGALGCVDMKRVAVHGHSMGAFLTVAIAGAFPGEIRAASHTAGGEQRYNKEYSLKVRAPYSIHHGDADKSVSMACDERFEATLTQNKVEHEMHVYPGVTHRMTSMNETVLERVKTWYLKHGVLK